MTSDGDRYYPVRGIASEPTISMNVSETLPRLWKTSLSLTTSNTDESTGILLLNKKNNIKDVKSSSSKRKLKFDSAVKVILIPTRNEYRSAGLGDVLWWSDRDYSCFKGSALMELRIRLSFDKCIDPKTALKQMYQPDNMQDGEKKVVVYNEDDGHESPNSEDTNATDDTATTKSDNDSSSNSDTSDIKNCDNKVFLKESQQIRLKNNDDDIPPNQQSKSIFQFYNVSKIDSLKRQNV